MTDYDVHHLAAAFSLDAVDDIERAAFERHLQECEVCRADVSSFREALGEVAAAAAATPPPRLRTSVLDEVARTRQVTPVGAAMTSLRPVRRMWLSAALGAAAAAVIATVTIVAITGDGSQGDPFAAGLAEIMEQADADVLDLAPLEGGVGEFRVAWSDSLGRAALIGENLPAAPDGKGYELWLITPDDSMAMYVLDPADDGDVHVTLEAPAAPTAWAITVEPAEGTPVATGEIIFLSEV